MVFMVQGIKLLYENIQGESDLGTQLGDEMPDDIRNALIAQERNLFFCFRRIGFSEMSFPCSICLHDLCDRFGFADTQKGDLRRLSQVFESGISKFSANLRYIVTNVVYAHEIL